MKHEYNPDCPDCRRERLAAQRKRRAAQARRRRKESKMAKTLTVEVFHGRFGSKGTQHWYWRLRWPNGRIAATSEAYATRATAKRLATKMAQQLGTLVVTPAAKPVVKAIKKTLRKQRAVKTAVAAVSSAKQEQTAAFDSGMD